MSLSLFVIDERFSSMASFHQELSKNQKMRSKAKEEPSAGQPLSLPGKKKKSKISGHPHKPGALPADQPAK
jgi:hypothetical protein